MGAFPPPRSILLLNVKRRALVIKMEEVRERPIDCCNCEGTGWVMIDNIKEVCQKCLGRGIVYIKNTTGKEPKSIPESPYD